MNLPVKRAIALRFLLATFVVTGALLPLRSAQAGAVYRCNGPGGQIAFTNNPGTYSGCKKVSNYADVPTPAVTGVASKRVDYRSETFAPAQGAATAPSAAPVSLTTPASAGASTEKTSADSSTEVRRGAVYKITRASGITEYTNVRPNRGAFQLLFTYISTCFACNIHSTINFSSTALNMVAYSKEVAAAALEFGIDPAFLRAVMHAESAFNPNAISNKGAQGLMQLMPGTASDLGVDNPFDTGQNIRGGAQYLGGLLKQFKGDERLATAAYNAGPQNVQKYNGVPPFDETRVYVDRVATLRQRYHSAQ